MTCWYSSFFWRSNGLDPLIGRPSPEGPPAFCHLAKKEQEYILAEEGSDARVVERIVQRLHQPIKCLSEVHRSTVTIEAVGFGIARQHILFDRSEGAGAVIAIQINRPNPRPVIGLLRFLLLRSPLCARCALKELGTLLGRQLLKPRANVVRPGLAVLPGSSLPLDVHAFISASICVRRACIWAILAASFADRSRPLRWI